MPKAAATAPDLHRLVNEFVERIVTTVETAAAQRVQTAISAALGNIGLVRRGPGRPPKAVALLAAAPSAPSRPRQKQLCPVPGCKNPAAPVFGMVCAEHKGVPKDKIKKYREQRRAEKTSGKRGGRKRAAKAA